MSAREEGADQESQRLLEDLKIYQEELEARNEELRWARDNLEQSRNEYLEIYQQAPVGYLTLDEKFDIIEGNQTILELLRTDMKGLLSKHILLFIPRDSQLAFDKHLFRASKKGDDAIELKLGRGENTFDAQLITRTIFKGNKVHKYRVIVQDISDRKRAEDALVEANEKLEERVRERTNELEMERSRLHAVLDQMPLPIGVVIAYANGKLLMANKALEDIFRYPMLPSSSIKEYSEWKAYHPEDMRELKAEEHAMAKALMTEKVVPPSEVVIRRGDRTFGIVLASAAPIKDQEGKLIGGVSVAVDITERKGIEDVLRLAEERLRMVLDNSLDGINMLDLATMKYVVFSPSQVAMTGFTAEELEGITTKKVFERTHPDDRYITTEHQRRVAAGEDIEEPVEYRWKVKSGEYRWFSDRRKVVRDPHGKPIALVGLSRDITEQKRMQQIVDEERYFLKATIDSIPIGVWIANRDGEVIEKNNMADRIWRGDVPLSKSAEQYAEYEAWFADTDKQLEVDDYPLTKALRTGESVKPVELRIRRLDGSLGSIIISAEPIMVGDEMKGAVVVNVDIGDRKRMEEDLKRSNAELQQFAYVASHDLQEPLRMVLSYLSLLKKKFADGLPEQGKEYLATSVEGAERMRQLVNDLLIFSRIDTQGEDFAPVDMTAVAEKVKSDLHLMIEESNASVIIDPLPTIHADEKQMVQVMTNLVSNALKYHDGGPPSVEISARSRSGEIVFAVKDDGIGIDPKYAEKLFRMFSRLHTREEYPGTGIGLAIAKKIVERHGGRIWFESEPGKGTTFFFTIPS